MDEAEFLFRPYTREDLPCILDNWGSSYFRGSSAHRSLTSDEFHGFHRPLRERFFSRPNTAVIICSPGDDDWHILGWIAVEKIPTGLVVQYLYVKSAFKTQGIAKQLIKRAVPTAPVFFTHLTDRAARIMSKKGDQFHAWRHVPHLI